MAARCNATYYETSCGMKCLPDISTTGTTICRTPCDAPVLSVHQKYSRPLAVAKDFGSLAVEEGMATFKERLAFLNDIAGQMDQALPLPVHVSSFHAETFLVFERLPDYSASLSGDPIEINHY